MSSSPKTRSSTAKRLAEETINQMEPFVAPAPPDPGMTPVVTQPEEEMEWTKVATPNRTTQGEILQHLQAFPRRDTQDESSDEDEDEDDDEDDEDDGRPIKTVHTDYKKTKKQRTRKDKDDNMAVDDNNTNDKDEDKDATEEAEADDPQAPPLSLFKFLLDHGQIESNAVVAEQIERWNSIVADPISFKEAIYALETAKAKDPKGHMPPMFLVCDKNNKIGAVVLHHFGKFKDDSKAPVLAALANDRIDATTPPSVVVVDPKNLCTTLQYSAPTETVDPNMHALAKWKRGDTLVAKKKAPKEETTAMLHLPGHWALEFLDQRKGDPWPRFQIPAHQAHGILIHLASDLIDSHPAAYNIVKKFAWGLITRKTTLSKTNIVAIALKRPTLTFEFMRWRANRLDGIFAELDEPPSDSESKPAAIPDTNARASAKKARLTPATPLFGSSQKGASIANPQQSAPFSPAFGQESNPTDTTPATAPHLPSTGVSQREPATNRQPAHRPPFSSAFGQESAQPNYQFQASQYPPTGFGQRTPAQVPKSAMKQAPHVVSPPAPMDPVMAQLLEANKTLMATVANLVQHHTTAAATPRPKHNDDDDDDEADPGSTPDKISKFTERRAAPFYAWAGLRPKHTCKTLPPFFKNMIEATSSQERSGLVTGLVHQLQIDEPATFAGWIATEDVITDASKLRLAPPQGFGLQWHRGFGPMAFAVRSIGDIDSQSANRELLSAYSDNLSLSMADIKKLESAPPGIPHDFEAFLLLLNRFTMFTQAVLGPDCDLYKKSRRVVNQLTSLRSRIGRSPEFMAKRAPTILWALTVATQEFYSNSATLQQFQRAEKDEFDPPQIFCNIDVADLGKLQITEACDLPVFLRHQQPRSLVPPGSRDPFTPSHKGGGTTPTDQQKKTSEDKTPTRDRPMRVNPSLDPALTTFMAQVPLDRRQTIGLRKVMDGCQPKASYNDVRAAMGPNTPDSLCLRYQIFGACGLVGCAKEHKAFGLAPGGGTTLCTLLQPGLTANLNRASP
jgi:hypothetical protein